MQTDVHSPSTPLSALRGLVQDYLQRHPRMTVQALAQRSQVPVTSLRRLLVEESKSEVAPHTALNLCAYIQREKRVGVLLKQLPSELAQFLEKHFGAFIFEGAEERVFSVDLNEVLKDRMNYFIYKLAANHLGTSWIEVGELFGAVGRRKTEELLAQSILVLDGERIKAIHQDFSLDLPTAAGHLPELVKFYRPEAVGAGQNLMYSLSESLTETAIQEIKDIQRAAAKATHAVMTKTENHGAIPYFTLNLCETFLSPTQGTLQ